MAILFAPANLDFLRPSGSPLVPTWTTMSLWFYPTTLTSGVSYGLYSQHNALGTRYINRIYTFGTDSKVYWEAFDGTHNDQLATSGTATLNSWNHLLVILDGYVSPIQRRMSLNGAAFDSVTPTAAPTVTTTNLGRYFSAAAYFAGRIAEVAYWSDALNQLDGSYTALSKGVPAFEIHPELLTQYWPLFNLGPSSNPGCLITRQTWIVNGSPVTADHCRRVERMRIGVS